MDHSPKGIIQAVSNSKNKSKAVADVDPSLKKPVLEDNSTVDETSLESQVQTSSSFLPDDGSLMSRDVDRWIQGWGSSSPVSTGVQRSRLTVVQRSTYTNENVNGSRFYYALTILIPLIRTRQRAFWRCSPR
ncbi:unnamed protein product, partial [Iphiclides podalirius]